MPAADTDLTAARVQRAVFASKSGDERTAMAFEMSEVMFQVTIDGIRRRFPDLDEAGVALQLIERLHGPEVAGAVAASGAVPGGH